MRPDPDTCTDPVLLAAEVRRLRAVIASGDFPIQDNAAIRDNALVESLRREVREQRREIAGLREERRALLDADRPQPDRPEAIATPAECTVPPPWRSRPFWVDPPSGWQYGFPRLYDPARDGNMRAWMIANGYPKKLASLGLPCTFTEWTDSALTSTEDGGK